MYVRKCLKFNELLMALLAFMGKHSLSFLFVDSYPQYSGSWLRCVLGPLPLPHTSVYTDARFLLFFSWLRMSRNKGGYRPSHLFCLPVGVNFYFFYKITLRKSFAYLYITHKKTPRGYLRGLIAYTYTIYILALAD